MQKQPRAARQPRILTTKVITELVAEYTRRATQKIMTCPYCSDEAKPATGADIYPHRPDLFEKKFILCKPCDAYVGCHAATGKPFGTLANAELRKARMTAHAEFDPLWQERGWRRKDAYATLALHLDIAADACHIGQFNLAQCRRVVVTAQELIELTQLQDKSEDDAYSGLEPDCML